MIESSIDPSLLQYLSLSLFPVILLGGTFLVLSLLRKKNTNILDSYEASANNDENTDQEY